MKYGAILLSILAYVSIGYLFPRTDFYFLISAFTVLFVGYYFFLKKNWFTSEKEIIGIAMLFRVLFLFSIPSLSDDFYRYLWDGQLLVDGINPFDFRPSELITSGKYPSGVLFEKMNSPHYYSVYPPTNQLWFTLSAWLGNGDWRTMLFVMKVVVLSAEFGTLLFISKIASKLNKGVAPLLIYGLNPLVIVEFSGNVHSEVIMLIFIGLFVWLLLTDKFVWSAISLALAICSKLIPVLILPFLIKKIGWKKTLLVGIITGVSCGLLFLPFYNATFLPHIAESLQLYFKTFEFNGGIYLLAKYIDGYWLSGFAKAVKGISLLLLVFLYFKSSPKREDVFKEVMLLFTVYFLFSSTVHPWYVAALVFYTSFTQYKYVLGWTALLPLTYFAYQDGFLGHPYFVIGVEYFLVLLCLIREFFFRPSKSSLVV